MSTKEKSEIVPIKIVIIGTGSLASALLAFFHNNKGISVVQQYGRSKPSESIVPYTDSLQNLLQAELYIIAVSDNAIPEIVKGMPKVTGLVIHTSGSVSLDVFKDKFLHYGSLYPLQSFTKNREIDLKTVPFILNQNSNLAKILFGIIAEQTSLCVTLYELSFEEKLQYHLAAVFANNFTNHMVYIAKELLEDKNLDFELLKPLLRESFDKILTTNPKDAQTGPAKRNDTNTMEKHLKMLTNKANFKEIYQAISTSITEAYKKE
jgi:predicted short-subunit dehydrogenase-like oxidoreductase (DUF2520 family)